MSHQRSAHPFPAAPTRVIHVGGEEREIGRSHAEQVGDAAAKGMPKFYYDFWKRMLMMEGDNALSSAAMRAVKWLIDPVLVGRLFAQVPDFVKERIQGLSDVTGAPYDQYATALILPDLLPLLQAYLVRLRPGRFVEATPPPKMGCTSFIANGDRFLVGRNLDFPGVAYWDRYQVIQVTSRKNALKFIGFTSAGVPIGGITGVNEAQISVSLHQHYCRETSLKGQLPFVIGEEILSRARNLQQARAILEKSKVASSWAFVVADGKARDAFVYESHPRACGTTTFASGSKVLAHSNFFQSKECRAAEYATTARMNWDNYWRKTRLEELATQAGPGLTAERACRIISDHYDGYWGEEKIINRTVSQVYNIQSVIYDLGEMKAYLAEGDCPIHLRRYQEYDLGAMFSGGDGKTATSYPGYQFASEDRREAKEAYILSFVSAFGGDFPSAFKDVRRSMGLDYCPEAGIVAGVLAMKLGDTGAAYDLLGRAKTFIEEKVKARGFATPPPEYFEACLYLARACDLLGKRDEALTYYRFVSGHEKLEDNNVKAIAKREGPYSMKALSRILMPYSTYIPFE